MSQPIAARRCGACFVELPTSATEPWCDDHEGGHVPPIPDPPSPPLRTHVVHNGLISKRNGGLDDMESGDRR